MDQMGQVNELIKLIADRKGEGLIARVVQPIKDRVHPGTVWWLGGPNARRLAASVGGGDRAEDVGIHNVRGIQHQGSNALFVENLPPLVSSLNMYLLCVS